MKENGIGRPSTRAAIIETLFRRKYIYRERKNILPTQAGIDLIDTINEELLKSAKLTGHWEHKLRRIERGDYSPVQFMHEINEMITKIVHNVLSDNTAKHIHIEAEKPAPAPAAKPVQKKPRAPRVRKIEDIVCPVCGKGHVVKGRTAFGCSEYASGCSFRLMFTDCPTDSTPAALKKRLYPTKKK